MITTKKKNEFTRRLWTEDDELAIEEMVVRLGAGLLIFTLIVTALIVFNVKMMNEANAAQTAQVERLYAMYTDNLVSPDMADYMQKQGSGLNLSEEDMQ